MKTLYGVYAYKWVLAAVGLLLQVSHTLSESLIRVTCPSHLSESLVRVTCPGTAPCPHD